MKHLLTVAAVIVSLVGSAVAGPVSFKKTVMEPRTEYGLGWYGAIQAGVNAYQGLPSFDAFNLNNNNGPATSKSNSDVGGVGGLKFGYVFNTGKIRPALEADLFYNGFGFNYQGFDAGNRWSSFAGSVNSFAYMANFIVRFDLGRFQPYVGGGIGGYWASSNIESISSYDLNGPDFGNGNFGMDSASWAWQIIGGADYYFTERVSAFFEYKFLNYEDCKLWSGATKYNRPPIGSILPENSSNIGQQLFVVGVRMHF